MIPFLLLAACDQDPAAADSIDAVAVDLSPREMLIRLSVDLRGIHPSEADLAAFEADASDVAYERYVDAWMADERFLGRMVQTPQPGRKLDDRANPYVTSSLVWFHQTPRVARKALAFPA